MNRTLLFSALREALVTLLAALATLACALALAPEPGPAILSVVLCLSLSRSQLDRDLRGRIEAAIALPLISLAALGVAMLLHHAPTLGAAAFVAALSLSIWLRRFGPLGRKTGTLIALPFVVILITPYVPPRHVSRELALALPIIVALLALFWVSLLHALAQRLRWLPTPVHAQHVEQNVAPNVAPTATAPRTGAMRPRASTRMAVQMGLALAAAFVVGHVFFDAHWAWVVLTAFIVNSGNQGRLDVAYKSLLRLLGAASGTVIALALGQGLGAHDTATVVLILMAVFMGVWLRPLGYAWWALFVTLALALLQGFEGASVAGLLGPRLLEILVGAIIGVAAAWLVWPVRSTDVLRRRMADVLATLAQALDPENTAPTPEPFLHALAGLDKLAPAFRVARWATRHWRRVQPADWIDTLSQCRAPALARISAGAASGPLRRTLGAARKAMREPESIGAALVDLRKALSDSAG